MVVSVMKTATPRLKFLLLLLVLLPPTFGDLPPRFEDDLHNSDDFLQADQPQVPASDQMGEFVPPQLEVTLKLGSGLEGSSIKEGGDIHFVCLVIYDSMNEGISSSWDISWFNNGIAIVEDQMTGVLVSGNDLVLQRVQKSSAGNYTCKVEVDFAGVYRNTFSSNIVTIDIEYSPVCRKAPQTVLVKEGDSMHLKCDVDARPNTDMRYTWYLNNTLNGNMEIYTDKSYINVTNMTDRNYGKYSCWASNNVGNQDIPCIFNVKKQNIVSEVERFLELIGTGHSWCDKYGSLAAKARENSVKVHEITNISQKVMRLLWKTWLDTVMWKDSVFEKDGILHRIPVDTSGARPHPLYVLNTNLTLSNKFTFEIIMKMKKIANIGLRLMWVPEEGAPYSWDDDDILYSAHFRWKYPTNVNTGKSKTVVFNTKKNGIWGENQTVFDEWPNFQIGQKFKLQITTQGTNTNKCFNMRLYMGHERFHIVPAKPPLEYVFCLPHAKHLLSDPRHLKLVLNEDISYGLTEAYDIYQVMYMPKVLQFSPGQIEGGL